MSATSAVNSHALLGVAKRGYCLTYSELLHTDLTHISSAFVMALVFTGPRRRRRRYY